MAEIFSVLVRIVFAVILVIGSMSAASALMEENVEPPRQLDMNAAIIWTTTPFRVDTRKQDYSRIRIVDAYPQKFLATGNFRVVDGATFMLNGDTYHLADISYVARKKLCTDTAGKKLACGLRALTALNAAMRGHFVECRRQAIAATVYLAKCRINNKDLAVLTSIGRRDIL